MNEQPDRRRTLHRTALRVMLGSVVASALMGSYAVLSDEFGEIEAKLLLSTLAIFGASIIVLACGVAWERRRLGVVPPLGVGLGLVGLVLLLVAIWVEPETHDDTIWRGITTEIALAVAATHASLVGLFGVGRRYRVAPAAAYALNAALTAILVYAVWWDPRWDYVFDRLVGVLCVLVVAVTIAIPLLRRLEGAARVSGAEASARFCPGCGAALDATGAGECEVCGARFQVQLTTQ